MLELKMKQLKLKTWENKIKRKDLKNETNKYIYDFQQFETIRSFGNSVYTGKVEIDGSNQSVR